MDTLRVDAEGRGIWLGETHVPWAQVDAQDIYTSRWTSYWRRAWIVFENGLGLSVIWGSACHCDNYEHSGFFQSDQEFIEEPTTVEVMVLSEDSVLHDQIDAEYKWPEGWVTIPELLRLMQETMKLPSDTKILPANFFTRDNER